MKLKYVGILCMTVCTAYGQAHGQSPEWEYRIEAGATAGTGTYAPLWFTSNRYGLGTTAPNSGYLRAGIGYHQTLNKGWQIDAALDLAGTVNHGADTRGMGFVVQQAYADLTWKALRLSIGSKERGAFPLERNTSLSSGAMVEGPNARPVPQVRIDIRDYLNVPGTGGWLAFKGHLAYGAFTDNKWQKEFTAAGNKYIQDLLYHSKSLLLRLGNREKLPVEFEFGLLMATQFGGDQYEKQADGSGKLTLDMPSNAKAFWKAFFPQAGGSDTPEGEQVNVEGNMLGSWNFALNGYAGDWTLRAYLEHYFEDTSQMFWEYGRWKDGLIGLEVTLPKNRWLSTAVWEGLCTKDQSGPLLYDGFWGQFPEYQISACDSYYYHYLYGAWQHAGMGMGNPLLPGPAYNDGKITFRSNRVRAHHLGLTGQPAEEWNWRVLISFARHWGTYENPLDKQRKQFSSLWEVTYAPERFKGWSASVALGMDRGNYLGNSTGGMITLRKTGKF